MNIGSGTEDSFDPALLSKADALIRRNRPDGVSTDAEELPVLTEAVDDLPELTDALEVPLPSAASPRVGAGGEDAGEAARTPESEYDPTVTHLPEVSMDLESDEVEDIELPEQDDARTAISIGFSSEQVEERVRDALDQARAEARVLQARAVQAAIEQGREEAMLAQQDYLAEVRREALQMAMMQVSERIVELDSHIAQALDAWVSRELPAIVAGQMDSMVERIRAETTAHMRATLLPTLSDKLAELLDSVTPHD